MARNNHKQAFYIFNMVVQFFFETFVAMALGFFIGRWIDRSLFDERVIFTYILVIIGIFAGLRNLIKRALKFESEDKKDEK